jgi:hypothetical protein
MVHLAVQAHQVLLEHLVHQVLVEAVVAQEHQVQLVLQVQVV